MRVGTVLGQRVQAARARRLLCFGVAAAAVMTVLPADAPEAAAAAQIDLTVNVSTTRAVYTADETATYVVRVDNRGTEATSAPATVTLDVPNTSGTPLAWESTVTCVASGGAVCPASFTRSGTTLTGTIPTVPVAGSVAITVQAPGEPLNHITGPVEVRAEVAPDATDTDADVATNSSYMTINIVDADIRYATFITGPGPVAGGQTVTYDVVVSNDGLANDLRSASTLTPGVGAASASANPLTEATFQSVACIAATGGASCSNLTRATFTGYPVSPVPSPLITPGTTTADLIVLDMPAASTVTLRYTVFVGRPACNNAAGASYRTLTVNTEVDPATGALYEQPAQSADNAAAAVTNVTAPPCVQGDLATVSIVQPAGQSSTGVAVGGPFSYDVTYSNQGSDAATDPTLEFAAAWPGTTNATLSPSPTCAPTGGATCPTTWSASGPTIQGSGAVIPPGATLVVTYTGTGGGDDPTVCRPRGMTARSRIIPPGDFLDSNYVPNGIYTTGAQTQGNNARQVATQTDVGSPCSTSHDDLAQQSGPFSDPAGTIPIVGNLQPGQVVYLRNTFTNTAPSPDYTVYRAAGTVATNPFSYDVFTSSDPERFFRHQGTDPAGLPYRDDDASFGLLTVPFDTGVRCTATGGATCPTEIDTAGSASGGGGARWIGGWATYWKPGTQPLMPAASQLSFVTSYKIPDLEPEWQVAGCVPNGLMFGGSGTATQANVQFNFGVSAVTNPASSDRNTLNDSVLVTVPVEITRCTQTLAVDKTSLTPTLPLDRLVRYQIVATNTSAVSLDVPRIIDVFSTDAPATITCTATTLGAVCPSFVPQQGVKRLADGTTEPSTFRESSTGPRAQFDFAWGATGADTMPAGSTVTFVVEVQYPPSYTDFSYNSVYFGAADGHNQSLWPVASDTAYVVSPDGATLGIIKAVNPVQPQPGQTMTFTVDLVHSGPTIATTYFRDEIDALFQATNPSGFGNVSCRALVSGDNVLSPSLPVGTTACPTITSNAGGLTATIVDFADNSGLRITYTAVAPLNAMSIPNFASLVQDDTNVTFGDAFAKVNILVMTASISGTVWDDADGSANGTFTNIDSPGEVSTNAGGLNAVLVDANTGQVIAVVPVNPDGTYRFESVPVNTDVTVVLTTENPAIGGPVGTPTLPAGWIATSPLTQVTFNTGVIDTVDKDFGIEQPPTTDDKSDPVRTNPGGTTQVQVPTLTGADPEDGPLSTTDVFQIVTLPDPSCGVLYYDGVPVVAGQIISGYDPTKLTVDPVDGTVTVTFTVAAIDAAGVVDPTPATVVIPFVIADVVAPATPSTTPVAPPTTAPTTTDPPGELPITGGNLATTAVVALALLGFGTVIFVGTRRRRLG